jgi:hypothetical protein
MRFPVFISLSDFLTTQSKKQAKQTLLALATVIFGL